MEETLRSLVAVGLGFLLILLRLDAERFGTAEYDEPGGPDAPGIFMRVGWYAVGGALIAAILLIHPDPDGTFLLSLGDRSSSILLGFVFGSLGVSQAAVWAWYRYGRFRWPPLSDYPGAAVNSVLTALIDEAAFRGVLLGVLLVWVESLTWWGPFDRLADWDVFLAVTAQTLVYALATRTGASGRSRYLLALSLAYGFIGGWLTVLTGGIGAAFIAHAITRFAGFVLTGHVGHALAPGAEAEEVMAGRLPPRGWRSIGRERREAAPRDR